MQDPRQVRLEVIDGAHRVWFEEPDTVVVVVRGTINETAMTQLSQRLLREAQSREYIFFLADLTQFETIGPAARAIGARIGALLPRRAFAIFGGSFGKRVVIDFVFRASNILGAKDRTMRYFADEEAARSWLSSMRSRLA